MSLLRRLKEWRAARRADREAVARAREESRRAGERPPRSLADTVEDAAGRFPGPN
ncbi:MAG TPA: hypothetical protein VLV46_12615 [Gaiellaceae bacterium]|nr:hypothetical protein [Gaiellaceae bacterium]